MQNNTTVKCPNCGGHVNLNPLDETTLCEYCNATLSISELLAESDDIKNAKITARVQRDIELGKQAVETEKIKHEFAKEEHQRNMYMVDKFKKSKFSKVVLVCTLLCAISTFSNFSSNILAGLITAVQTGLFAVSWLMGMQFIKEKKYSYHILPTIIAFALFIPYAQIANAPVDNTEKFEWSDIELHEILPEPESNQGEIHTNSNDKLWIDIVDLSEKQYNDYIDACKNAGFTIDKEQVGISFDAYNDDGFKLGLIYYSTNEEMSLRVDPPIEMGEITWPSSEVAMLIPLPKSNIGDINWENSNGFSITLGETPIDEYDEYVILCSEMGFNVDYDKGDHHYNADNENGYSLSVRYEGNNVISIQLEAPEEENSEDNQATVDNEITEGDIVSENSETELEPIETASTETESVELVDEMRPEFKEAMDSYEVFFDEYVAFMKKYNESSDSLDMMNDYIDFMNRYTETMMQLSEIESQEMNSAELDYYTEAMLRINQKLLEVL